MPHLPINGTELYYEDTGGDKPVILFSHGLLWSSRMFAKQVEHFQSSYRIITYDHRGQGRSAVPSNGYDMDNLTQDALALMDALEIEQFHFAGLSMGGFVGLRIAARAPERLLSLILIETSAQAEPEENVPRYRMLSRLVKLLGIGAVKKPVMKIMFGQSFLEDPERKTLRIKWEKELTRNRRSITRAVKGVIEREGVPPNELEQISCPTLIIVGEEDTATVPEKSEYMQRHIPNAQLKRIPRAGHTSTVEEPEAVNVAMERFLTSVG
jgi:pimeloyl-ACP methyl ester carboxylesterase